MEQTKRPWRAMERTEPRVSISVFLLQSERDELAAWAKAAGVSMNTYLRFMVQDASVQRFYARGCGAPSWMTPAKADTK